MRKYIVFVTAITLLLCFTGCNEKEVHSDWSENQPVADGKISDWENLSIYTVEKPDLTFGITNNNDYLTVLVGFRNLELIGLFHMTGVTLWIDNTGKKKKEMGLRLAGPMLQRRNRRNPDARSGKNNRNKDQRSRRTIQRGFSLVAKGGLVIPIDYIKNKPEGKYKIDSGQYTIEFKIPMEKDNDTPYALESGPGREVSIGFEAGGNMKNIMSGPRGSGGAESIGGRGGRGGGRGGGMKGGGGRGGRGNMTNMPESKEMWVKVTIAGSETK